MREFNKKKNSDVQCSRGDREQYENLVRDIISELYSNARYWEFFQSFDEVSVNDFISDYAAKKAWYLLNGAKVMDKKSNDSLRFREMAEYCFWEIQQKKLFNLQAEWRSGILDIKEVTVTRDFLCWEQAIAKCPFLEPVSRADFGLYLEYLDSGTFAGKNWLYGWQDYEAYRSQNPDTEVMPAWYSYYDRKMGTGYLMLLPDKRGEKEQQYLKAWNHARSNSDTSDLNGDCFSGEAPVLSANYQSLDFFIRTFENQTLLKIFQATEPCPDDTMADAELQDAIRMLSKTNEAVPVPASGDWKEAVIKAAQRYKIQQIKSNLVCIYEEYLFRIENGIIPHDLSDRIEYEERLTMTLNYRQQIERGKKIVGE